MTSLAKRKTRLTFETSASLRQRGKLREVVVEAHEYGGAVRLKGTRQRLEFSWEALYYLAAKVAADKARAERKARRTAVRP